MAVAQALRTHCPAGHPYDEVNTSFSSGRRHCRACGRARYTPVPKVSLAEKLDARTNKTDSCWLWTGAKQTAGYGVLSDRLAHRLSYERWKGPIPAGLTIDHLCRVRHCVNPEHLEAVTLAENVLRGESLPARNARRTHCPQGHPYDQENTHVNPKTGWRMCRACNRERARAARLGGGTTTP